MIDLDCLWVAIQWALIVYFVKGNVRLFRQGQRLKRECERIEALADVLAEQERRGRNEKRSKGR